MIPSLLNVIVTESMPGGGPEQFESPTDALDMSDFHPHPSVIVQQASSSL